MEDNATCHKSNIIKNRQGNKLKAKTALSDEEIDILFEKTSWEQVLCSPY